MWGTAFMKKFIGIGFIICVTFILFLSGQSGSQAFGLTYRLAVPLAEVIYDSPDYDQLLVVMNGIRFLGRVVAFTVFGGFFTALIHAWCGKLSRITKEGISFLGIIIFGIFDETHKLLIDGRHCTLSEILVNIVCGLMGAVVTIYILKKYKKM